MSQAMGLFVHNNWKKSSGSRSKVPSSAELVEGIRRYVITQAVKSSSDAQPDVELGEIKNKSWHQLSSEHKEQDQATKSQATAQKAMSAFFHVQKASTKAEPQAKPSTKIGPLKSQNMDMSHANAGQQLADKQRLRSMSVAAKLARLSPTRLFGKKKKKNKSGAGWKAKFRRAVKKINMIKTHVLLLDAVNHRHSCVHTQVHAAAIALSARYMMQLPR